MSKPNNSYNKLDDSIVEYLTNPSIKEAENQLTVKKSKRFLKNGNKALVIDESTGEHLGTLGAMFLEEKVVDTEQFIKIYTLGIEELTNLSNAGLKIFKLVYKMMLESPNNDTFTLNFTYLKEIGAWEFSKVHFHSGVNELLMKKILYKSKIPSQFFININLFFNGDRITTIKTYRLKSATSPNQLDLFEADNLLE